LLLNFRTLEKAGMDFTPNYIGKGGMKAGMKAGIKPDKAGIKI